MQACKVCGIRYCCAPDLGSGPGVVKRPERDSDKEIKLKKNAEPPIIKNTEKLPTKKKGVVAPAKPDNIIELKEYNENEIPDDQKETVEYQIFTGYKHTEPWLDSLDTLLSRKKEIIPLAQKKYDLYSRTERIGNLQTLKIHLPFSEDEKKNMAQRVAQTYEDTVFILFPVELQYFAKDGERHDFYLYDHSDIVFATLWASKLPDSETFIFPINQMPFRYLYKEPKPSAGHVCLGICYKNHIIIWDPNGTYDSKKYGEEAIKNCFNNYCRQNGYVERFKTFADEDDIYRDKDAKTFKIMFGDLAPSVKKEIEFGIQRSYDKRKNGYCQTFVYLKAKDLVKNEFPGSSQNIKNDHSTFKLVSGVLEKYVTGEEDKTRLKQNEEELHISPPIALYCKSFSKKVFSELGKTEGRLVDVISFADMPAMPRADVFKTIGVYGDRLIELTPKQ